MYCWVYVLNADNGLEVNVASGGFYIPVGCYALHFYWWALSPLDNISTPDGLFVRRAPQSGVVKCLRDIFLFFNNTSFVCLASLFFSLAVSYQRLCDFHLSVLFM